MKYVLEIIHRLLYVLIFIPSLLFAQSVEKVLLKSMSNNSYTIGNIYKNAQRMEFDRFCSIMVAHAYWEKMSLDISVDDIINADYQNIDSLETSFLHVLKNEAPRTTLVNKGPFGVDMWIGDTLVCDAFPPFECDSSLSIVTAWYDPYDIGRNILAAFDAEEEVDVPNNVYWQFVNDIDSILDKSIPHNDKTFLCKHIHHLFEYKRNVGLRKICSCNKDINHIDSLAMSEVCDKYCNLYGYDRISFDSFLTQGDDIFAPQGVFSNIDKLDLPFSVCNGQTIYSLGQSFDNHDSQIYNILGLAPNSPICGYLKLSRYYLILTGSWVDLSVHVVDMNGNKLSQLYIESDSYIIDKYGMIYVTHGELCDRYVITLEGRIIKQNSLH